MRIIKFKSTDSTEFKNFIDIGSCDRDYYVLYMCFPDPDVTKSGKTYFESYTSWFENFKNESIGAKMLVIHYFLSQYMGWNLSENSPRVEYFENLHGVKMCNVISDNLNFLLQFHEKWFWHQTSLFKGLDFDWDDIRDRFIRTVETEDGIFTEIEFDDGSIISFLDNNDDVRSFFVAEEDFIDLKNAIDSIVNMFTL
jgi:hypothetical protein